MTLDGDVGVVVNEISPPELIGERAVIAVAVDGKEARRTDVLINSELADRGNRPTPEYFGVVSGAGSGDWAERDGKGGRRSGWVDNYSEKAR